MMALMIINLLFCFPHESRGFLTPYKLSQPYQSHTVLMAEKIGGAYEYTGPMSGGVPVEIAGMFNLKKGRKIKKGSGVNNRKSSSSSSSPSSSSSSSSSSTPTSSSKSKKSKSNSNEYDDDEFGMEALERQVISKYGSKSIKESVLTPIDAEDKALQQERMASRTRFEGFGAKPLSPTRAAMQQQPITKASSTTNKRSSSSSSESAGSAAMSEEDLSRALFKGSRTMSQYVSTSTSSPKSKSTKNRDDESAINQSLPSATATTAAAVTTNPGGGRHWDFAVDFMSGNQQKLSPPSQPLKINRNNNDENIRSKSKSNVVAVDDDDDDDSEAYADEFYNNDDNDGFGNRNDDNNSGVKKYIPKSQLVTSRQPLKQDRPPRTRPAVVRTPLSTNGKMKLKPFFKDDKQEEEEVDIDVDGDDMMDNFFDDDDDYEDEDEDDDDDDEEEELIVNKAQSKQPQQQRQQQQQPFTRSNPSLTSSASSASVTDPVVPPVMYRLRAPVTPVAPILTEKQQKQLQLKQIAEAERAEIKLQKYQEKKLLEKNEFYPFEFEEGDAKSINTDTNKLFSKTSNFHDLGITNERILNNLMINLNIATPTRIQELGIPVMLSGRHNHVNTPHVNDNSNSGSATSGCGDVVMQAHTGSGKTLAFLLPLIDYIDTSKSKVQAIVMASSRELVSQIGLVAESLFNNTGVNVQTLIGGANVQNQIQKLKTVRPHVLVATPGRLAELVFKLEKIKLGNVRVVIIDEADQMLCEPYLDELDTLLDAIPMFRHRGSTGRSSVGVSVVGSGGVEVMAESAPVVTKSELPTMPSSDSFKLPDIATLFQLPTSEDDDDEVKEKESSSDMSNDDDDDDDNAISSNTLEDIYDKSTGNDGADINEPQVVDEELQQQQMQQKGSFICLASATSTDSEAVKKFANKYMRPGWRSVVMDGTQLLPPTITHGLISIPRIRALEMLRKFLNAKPTVTSAIVFVNDPYRVQIVCDQLTEMSLIAAPLHGESSKEERKDVLNRLRDGRIKFVVSTELAARGLDIPELSHVVNFDLPTDCQHYIHRAGRCGRAGRQGLVMNFANSDTKFVARRFGKQLNVKVMDCEIRSGQVFLKKR